MMELGWSLVTFNMALSASSSEIADDTSGHTQWPNTSSRDPFSCYIADHNKQNHSFIQRHEQSENVADDANSFDRWSTLATNEEDTRTSSEAEFESFAQTMTGLSDVNHRHRPTCAAAVDRLQCGGLNWFSSSSTGSTFPLQQRQQLMWSSNHQPSLGTAQPHSGVSGEEVDATGNGKKRKKSRDSLVPMVATAILSQPDRRMALKDINDFIASRGSRSLVEKRTWKNNVRHVLSHYEFFVKNARVATGAGFYWSIHPACLSSFSAGDFSIKKARHAVQQFQKMERLNRDSSCDQQQQFTQQQEQQQPPCVNITSQPISYTRDQSADVHKNGSRSPTINHMQSGELLASLDFSSPAFSSFADSI